MVSFLADLDLYEHRRATNYLSVTKIDGGFLFHHKGAGAAGTSFLTDSQVSSDRASVIVDVFIAEDFGVIDSTKIYRINGVIDMGAASISIPSTGINIIGYTFDISQLISSEDNYTMFTGSTGNIVLSNLGFTTNGASSKVFNVNDSTGFNALEFNNINFNDCSAVGEFNGYRQGFLSGGGYFGGMPITTFTGTWLGGFIFDNVIVRGLDDFADAFFKAGAGFIMASRFKTNLNVDLPASASLCDFRSSNFTNDSTLQFRGCLVTRNGVTDSMDANFTPNVSASNLVSSWSGNLGLDNTFTGGRVNLSTEAVTSITNNIWTVISGTYSVSKLVHFDNPATDQLRHLGGDPIEHVVLLSYVFEGGANDIIELRFRKFQFSDSTTSTVGSTQRRTVNNFQGGNDRVLFQMFEDVSLNENDYLFIEVRNTSDNTNVTLLQDSYYEINQR